MYAAAIMGSASEELEEEVEKILNGDGIEISELDSEPQPVMLKKNVCYIVCGIIFNSEGEVLMVQEAKSDCYGRWYLPAGRMERGESIHEALQREVLEESGLHCQPITMLLLEEHGPRWIRFTFLAEVTGGSLKTPAQADSESLQAGWWNREDPLPLRSWDLLPLINAGLKYRQTPRFSPFQPALIPCPAVCQRVLLVFLSPPPQNEDEQHRRLWLLTGDVKGRPLLPVRVTDKSMTTVTRATYELVRELMPASYRSVHVNTRGLLGVQHDGKTPGQSDGVCFNTLVTLGGSEEDEEEKGEEEGARKEDLENPPPIESENYSWYEVTNQSLKSKIVQRIKDGALLPMRSL